jgi:hypothetical protein
MNTPWQVVTTALATFPTEEAPPIDPERVTPGLLGFLSFVFLVVAAVLLYRSMNKQMKKIDPTLPPGPSDRARQADVDIIERASERGAAAASGGAAAATSGGAAADTDATDDPATVDPRANG